MNSIIYLEAFQERFVSGLIFSMIEGLCEDQSIVFASIEPLDDFRLQLENANIEGISCSPLKKEGPRWEIVVSRKRKGHEHECCGICGGMEKSS